jgi:hypothetical protein
VPQWLSGEGVWAIAPVTRMKRTTIAEHVRLPLAVGVQRDGPPAPENQVAGTIIHPRLKATSSVLRLLGDTQWPGALRAQVGGRPVALSAPNCGRLRR